MVSAKVVKQAVNVMSAMKFFPASTEGIGLLLRDMCATDEQVIWLAKRMLSLYNEWPGPHELRAVLCSKFKPSDGGEDSFSSDPRFIENGIPSESTKALPAPDYKRLPPGSEDAKMNALVVELSRRSM